MKDVEREERAQWLKAFMPLYEQAAPLIRNIAKKVDADGLRTDVGSLVEGYEKLPPILQSVKEIPKPKEKELRKLKKDFEDLLVSCIRAGEWGIKFVQDPSRIRFGSIVFFTSVANGLMESFSKRLAALSGK
jgi:hypothetical protein